MKDDNTLTIPTGHRVFYDEDWEAYYYIAWATYNDDFEFVLDETKTEITFTIDGDQLVLEDSDDEHIIGLFCADEEEDYGYWGIGDYETVFALDEGYVPATETLVTLPDGATPEEWYTEGEQEQDWSADEFSGTAQLYIDGNDIYVGGLFEDAEEGWIKGTADDYGTVTFKSYQYLGNGLWALGTRGPAVLDSFRMYYDEDAATLTLIDQIKASSSLYELNNDEQTLLKLTLMQEKPAEPFIFDLPYSNGFNTPEEQKMFTAIDANEDGVTWHTLANEMQLTTSTNGSDDWLVSPKIWLDAGRSYHFSIYIRNTNRTMAERMEVRAALEQSADALSEGVQVIAPTEFKATQNGSQFINSKTLENEFRVEESGFYYIGFHSMNEGTAQMLSVDNFLLEAAPLTVPYTADFKESQSYMDDFIVSGEYQGYTYVGNAQGFFQPDGGGEKMAYFNMYVISPVSSFSSEDYAGHGFKAEKFKCTSAEVWANLQIGEQVNLFFDNRKRVQMAVSVAAAPQKAATPDKSKDSKSAS